MPTNFPDSPDTFAALTPGEDGSQRNVPVGGRTNTGYLNDLGDAVEAIEDYLLDNGPAGEAATSAIRQGDMGFGDRKLFGWRRALAAGRARILVIGDSNAEGSNGLADMSERWLNLLAADLRARNPIPGGDQSPDGYIPVDYIGADIPGPALTMTGHWSINIAVGMGKRAARLQSDTGGGVGMAAYTFTGTHFAIQWVGLNNMGKSEYRIDGGSWVELNHDDDSLFLRDHLTDPIDCGGRGEHDIEVRYKSSGAAAGANADPHIGGIWFIDADDPETGITVFDAAHAGYSVDNFNAFPSYLIGDWVEMVDADLLVVQLPMNSWQLSTPDTIDADVADYKAALVTLIAAARDDRPDLEVVLRGSWTPLDSAADSVPADMARFVAAEYEIAADDPLTSVFDSAAVLPPADGAGDDGTFWDTFAIHMSVSGHAAYASQLAEILDLPTVGAYHDDPAVRSGDVRSIVTITQDDYDLLDPPLPGVLYVITG
jgi:hypothetical protein